MKTYITLAILNLGDVALECGSLVGTELDADGDTVSEALRDLISDSQIVNHATPKLVGVFDHPNGGADIVYRVRTNSRAGIHRWQPVDDPLSVYDRKILERALESERT